MEDKGTAPVWAPFLLCFGLVAPVVGPLPQDADGAALGVVDGAGETGADAEALGDGLGVTPRAASRAAETVT